VFIDLIRAAIAPSMDAAVAEAAAGSHLGWLRADEERARLKSVWAEWFESYDLLLCPALALPAFPHCQEPTNVLERTLELNGERVPYIGAIQWPGLIGVVGLPSAVPPLARTPDGMPVGMQVVAPYLRDRDAVRAAGLIAAVAGGYTPPPGF